MTLSSPPGACPLCGLPLPAQDAPPARCPRCALPLTGAPADRLHWMDAELHRLEQQRGTLLAYRSRLLSELRAGAPAGWAPRSRTAPATGPRLHPPGSPPGAAAQRGEASPHTTRNVLLVLGGLLLAVAALAFTLLSWGRMGIGGRAAVLATLTLLAAGLPVLLLRRALNATAESVAAVGLVLLLLDAYALRQVSLQHTDLLRYTAGAVAVVALLWTAYGLLLPRPGLRVPLPAAVVLGQLPIPLWAASTGAETQGMAWALLATAAGDALLAVPVGERRPPLAVRVTAAVTALLTGVPALLLAAWLSVAAHEPPAAVRVGALLLAAAGVLLFAGRREKAFAAPSAGAAGLLVIAATGGLVRTLVPSEEWVVPGYLLCAVALAAATAGRRPSTPLRIRRRSARAGLLGAAAVMHAVALLYGVPALLEALFAPPAWAASPWQGAPAGAAGTTLAPGVAWTGDAGTPVLFAVPALVLAAASRFPGPDPVRRPAAAGALALGGAAAVVTPPALGFPYAAVVSWLVALVVGLLALAFAAARRPAEPGAAGVTVLPVTATAGALVAGVTVTGWALAERVATFAVLLVLGAAFAAAAWGWVRREAGSEGAVPDKAATDKAARDKATRDGEPRGGGAPDPALEDAAPDAAAPGMATPQGAAVQPVSGSRMTGAVGSAAGALCTVLCAAAAALCAAGLARALPAALGVPAEQAAFAVLALAAATAPIAARLRPAEKQLDRRGRPARTAASVAVECTGYGAAGWALVLSATSASLLALALGLCGVLAGGVALRDDRRPAGYVASGLFLLATWVRLYASEVSVPEAYTLPLAVAALVMGLLRARRSPQASSWTAYGPALSCALLPSLLMIWGDPHWLRPLLLGAGALAVTLLGARLRLQAPLLTGGTVLALVAGHELAPYVTQVIGLLPRWLPPALAGLLLLAVGATYEQRLREARRLRAAWRRLG